MYTITSLDTIVHIPQTVHIYFVSLGSLVLEPTAVQHLDLLLARPRPLTPGHICVPQWARLWFSIGSFQAPYTCVRLVKFLAPVNFPMLNSMNQSECSVPRIVSLINLSLFVSSCMSLGRAQYQQNGTGWNYPNHLASNEMTLGTLSLSGPKELLGICQLDQ